MSGQILIVDDLSLSRMILRAKLDSACFDSLMAATGTQALELAHKHQPDLILLDYSLPDLDGADVCRRLRTAERTRDIPIIIYSSDQSRDVRLRALKAGADDFLCKPLDESYLMSRLRNLLRSSGTRHDLKRQATPALRRGLAEASVSFSRRARVIRICGPDKTARDTLSALGLDDTPCLSETLTLQQALGLKTRGPAPDVFIIAPDVIAQHGVHVISDLQSRAATRRASIIVVMPPEMRVQASMALDLGATDVLRLPLDEEEAQLRLAAAIRRKQQADALRKAFDTELTLASRDPLTGLFNRRHALSKLQQMCKPFEAGRARDFAVLMIDLDNFKQVNDRFGHNAGDDVLVEATRRIRQVIRPTDVVARYGGEEFLVILPRTDLTVAQRIARRICQEIKGAPYPLQNGATLLQLTASLGMTVHHPGAEEDHTLCIHKVIDRADRAMRRAKQDGRNRVIIDDEVLQQDTEEMRATKA